MITRRVRLGADKKRGFKGWLIPYDDARRDVVIFRKMIDIWKGDPGSAYADGKTEGCMNDQCALRNKRLFPHPVFAVSTIKSRMYVVDKVDRKTGEPLHCVKYVLSASDGDDIARHDVLRTAVEATLTLRAPRGTDKKGAVHGDGSKRGPSHPKDPKSASLSRGEEARLLAAVGAMRE